jgi:autotransporter-associated beta strand protein
MLATLDITGNVLTFTLGASDQWLAGGNSLDGNTNVPLYFQCQDPSSSVTLSGDAGTYFQVTSSDHTDDMANLKADQNLEFLTSIVITGGETVAGNAFTLGDNSLTLPNLGAALSVASSVSTLSINSSINTGTANQDYHCATLIDGAITLAGNNIAFGGTINGSGGNDRLTIETSGTLQFTGTIGQTAALDFLSLTVASGDVMLRAARIAGLSSDLRVSVAGDLTQAGAITGTTAFTLLTGTATLDRANTYTGQTRVVSGTLNLHNTTDAAIVGDLTIGDGTGEAATAVVNLQASDQLASTTYVSVNGDGDFELNDFDQTINGLQMTGGRVSTGEGVLTLHGNVTSLEAASQAQIYGNLDLGGVARTFDVDASDLPCQLLVAAVITDGSLVKEGLGTLELNGANLFTGNVNVNHGILLLSNNAGLGTGAGTTRVAQAATLILSGVTIEENLQFDSTVGLTAAGESPSVIEGDVQLLSGLGVVLDQQSLTINGVISDGTSENTAGLHVTGDGILTLTGENTYRGGTVIHTGGMVAISSDANLGAVPDDFAPGNLQINAGYLYVRASCEINANRGLVVGAVGAMISVDAGETVVYGGVASNEQPGALVKCGDGTLVLGGENTYSGGTQISGGTLSISSDANLGEAPASAAENSLVFHGGTLLVTASFTLDGNRGITLDEIDGNRILVAQNETLTYAGNIAGAGSLTQVGDGTLVLSGENQCTGTITVEAGTLEVDGQLAACPLVVDGGTLTGRGQLGNVTLQAGTVAADEALGTLQLANLSAAEDTAMQFGIVNLLSLEASALLEATGSVALGDSTLVIDAQQWLGSGTQVVLVSATGGVTGQFANAADGALVQALSGQYFRIHIGANQVTAEAQYHKTGLPGLYDPETSTFYLRDSNTSGSATNTFGYGQPGAGWLPVVGDWNGDGIQTVGLYDPVASVFYLRNSNSSGMADLIVSYGAGDQGWLPVIGDWTGSGTDTIGLYDPAGATWYLRNSNSSGMADLTFAYGAPGATWTPLTGDWNADGIDTIGLYDASSATWQLRNSNSTGVADVTFAYGAADSTWAALAGDWLESGNAGPGLFDADSATWYLRCENSTGCADRTFAFGATDTAYTPIVGDWIGPPLTLLRTPSAEAVDQLDLSALASEALDNPTSLDGSGLLS